MACTGQRKASASAASIAYTALLTVYFLTARNPSPSKSLIVFHIVRSFATSPGARLRRGFSQEERVALLATALKAFFGPNSERIIEYGGRPVRPRTNKKPVVAETPPAAPKPPTPEVAPKPEGAPPAAGAAPTPTPTPAPATAGNS